MCVCVRACVCVCVCVCGVFQMESILSLVQFGMKCLLTFELSSCQCSVHRSEGLPHPPPHPLTTTLKEAGKGERCHTKLDLDQLSSQIVIILRPFMIIMRGYLSCLAETSLSSLTIGGQESKSAKSISWMAGILRLYARPP